MLATVSTARRPRTKGTLKNKGPLLNKKLSGVWQSLQELCKGSTLEHELSALLGLMRAVKYGIVIPVILYGSVVKGTTRDTAHSW
jgi:hypothetical protein